MTLDTIVVGFDGSQTAELALDAAARLVSPEGTVHVVVAYDLPSTSELSHILSELPEEFHSTFNVLQQPESDMQAAVLRLDQHEVSSAQHMVKDHPASAIMDVADQVDADLIVVGSRGMSRSTRYLRGSVSTRVASHSTRSFMVIHDRD